MHFGIKSLGLCLLFSVFFACSDSNTEKIMEMEKAYLESPTSENSTTLIDLYKTYAKLQEKSDLGFDYMVKAAVLQFKEKHDATSAIRWLDDALQHYGSEKVNKTEALLLLTELFKDYKYKTTETISLGQSDSDLLEKYMQSEEKNIEDVRLKVKAAMKDPGTGTLIPKLTEQFISISEALACSNQIKNPNKYIELNYESGNAARAYGNYNKAIQMYYSIADNFPESSKTPEALFLVAFTYDNDMKDFEKAKKAYQKVIDQYPNTQYGKDSKSLIEILGMPLDDVIRQLEKKSTAQ